jgi:tRNA-splicing ligase RtcB (3'-phosphate/5'-hydroxy nucleic acid ligase)
MAQTTNAEILSPPSGGMIKSWTKGVIFETQARQQLENIAGLPFIHKWVAAMPDVHLGIGATVGSVIPTKGAIIPAAVGVDIGCGMMAQKTSLVASDLPDNLSQIRAQIERDIPVGDNFYKGDVPDASLAAWEKLDAGYVRIMEKHPKIHGSKKYRQLGTLGGGNHFIELCLDEAGGVWVMLHSGSRGIGNALGRYFIELAKRDMENQLGSLPDRDLAYFKEGSRHFADYVEAVYWAQDFARLNRDIMMGRAIAALRRQKKLKPFTLEERAVNCHHNYVELEHHYGADVFVTRKGAVRARHGDLGIIPGSMGAKSFIVRGKGNPESFCSCSHGAGRAMSRTKAKEQISLEEHRRATAGVECRKDAAVIDESPAAYKDIDAVMAAQSDLVEIVHTLKQVVCVKG